jgi:hypothetical protein
MLSRRTPSGLRLKLEVRFPDPMITARRRAALPRINSQASSSGGNYELARLAKLQPIAPNCTAVNNCNSKRRAKTGPEFKRSVRRRTEVLRHRTTTTTR